MQIEFVKGDATRPQGSEPKVIVHCCNDLGAFGAGFALALSKAWPLAKTAYQNWAQGIPMDPSIEERVGQTGPFQLGEVQFVLLGPKLWVANLIGQQGVGKDRHGRAPIRYDAIQKGLQKVARFCLNKEAVVTCPRFGSGLSGGNWKAIEQLVNVELLAKNVKVTVYDLP